MAYLEQSTRYVPYTDRPNGRWKYHVPAEVAGSPLASEFARTMDYAFEVYARWIPAMEAHFRAKYPKAASDSDGVYRSVIRAKALDTLRGLLPAATTSNVGLFGTGQAFEALLLRMFAHPLEEVRAHADPHADRAPQSDPGVSRAHRSAWTRRTGGFSISRRHGGPSPNGSVRWSSAIPAESRDEVTLTEFDPEGEIKVVASALYAVSSLPDDQLLGIARQMSARGSRRRPSRLRRRSGEPSAQARPRVRAHALSIRRPRRLRRVPRSPASSSADARMAAAVAGARLRRTGGDRRGGRAGRLAGGDGTLGDVARRARRRAGFATLPRTRWSWRIASGFTWT